MCVGVAASYRQLQVSRRWRDTDDGTRGTNHDTAGAASERGEGRDGRDRRRSGRPLRRDLAAAGVERVAKTVGIRGGLPLLEDGRVIEAANVIWCTGFRSDFSWIELPPYRVCTSSSRQL